MTTYLYVLAEDTERRWQEIDLLINKAQAEKNVNPDYYDALCRAVGVLIVAHLESYIRDIVKSVIRDINTFSSFNASPMSMKRTFCKTYIDESMVQGKQLEERVSRLISTFNSLDTKFVVDPFLAQNEQGHDRNPAPDIITKMCGNLGVKNIFTWLKSPQLDLVFIDSTSDIESLINNLRSHVLGRTLNYPYDTDITAFQISDPVGINQQAESLYRTFLDGLLRTRHDVAHGNSFDNNVSVEELIQSRNKVVVLGYALMLIIAHKLK